MKRVLLIIAILCCPLLNGGCYLPYDLMAIKATFTPSPNEEAYKREQATRKEVSRQNYEVKLTLEVQGKTVEVKKNYNCNDVYNRKPISKIRAIEASVSSNTKLVVSFDEISHLCYKLYTHKVFSVAHPPPPRFSTEKKVKLYVFVVDDFTFPHVMQYYGNDLGALKQNLDINIVDLEFTVVDGPFVEDDDKYNWIYNGLRYDERGIEYESYFLIKADFSDDLQKLLKENVHGEQPVQLYDSQSMEWLYKFFPRHDEYRILKKLKLQPKFEGDYFSIFDKQKVTDSRILNLVIRPGNTLSHVPAEPITFYKHISGKDMQDFVIKLPSGGVLEKFKNRENELESLIYDPEDGQLYWLFIIKRKINPFEYIK